MATSLVLIEIENVLEDDRGAYRPSQYVKL